MLGTAFPPHIFVLPRQAHVKILHVLFATLDSKATAHKHMQTAVTQGSTGTKTWKSKEKMKKKKKKKKKKKNMEKHMKKEEREKRRKRKKKKKKKKASCQGSRVLLSLIVVLGVSVDVHCGGLDSLSL